MAFVTKDWKDSPNVTTPLSAAAIEDLELRLSDYSDDAAGGVFPIESYGGNLATAVAACDAAGGGRVSAGPDTFSLPAARVTVPDGVSIWGAGNNQDSSVAPTVFECSGANSGLTFEGSEGTSGNFTINGNSVGNNPWKVDLGHGRTFIALNALHAVQDNLWVADGQNAVYLGCTLGNAGRDNLCLDLGSTGNLFSRLQCTDPGRYGIRITQSGAGAYGHPPGMNKFDTCHVEDPGNGSTGAALRVEFSHYMNMFDHCVFMPNSGNTGPAVELVEAAAGDIQLGSLVFENCAYVNSNATVGTKAVKITLNTNGWKMLFTGLQALAGYDYLMDDAGGTNDGDAVRMGAGFQITNGYLSASADPNAYTEQNARIDFVPNDSATSVIRGLKRDKTGLFFQISPGGLIAWGSGANYVPDTYLMRWQARLVATGTDNCLRTGSMTAGSAISDSVFVNSADGKLSYKDIGGTVHALY